MCHESVTVGLSCLLISMNEVHLKTDTRAIGLKFLDTNVGAVNQVDVIVTVNVIPIL